MLAGTHAETAGDPGGDAKCTLATVTEESLSVGEAKAPR